MGSSRTIDVQQLIDDSSISGLQKRAIAMCLGLAVVDGFDSLMLGFVVPAIAKDWGMTAAGLTPLIMGGLIGTIVGGLLLAPLGDRYGRRKVATWGVLFFGAFTLVAAFAPNLVTLVILRFIAGLGLGAVVPNLFGYGAEYAPKKSRATVVTVIGAALAAGGFFGGFLSAWMIGEWGWRSVFVLGGLAPLVAGAIAWRGMPETVQFNLLRGKTAQATDLLRLIAPTTRIDDDTALLLPAAETTAKAPFAALWAEGRALRTFLLWLVYFNGMLLTFFIFSWMPSLLTAAGLGGSVPQIVTSLYSLGGMIGGVLLGIAADRRTRSPARLLTGGFIFAVAATWVTAQTVGNLIPVMFAGLALGIGVSGTLTCVNAVAAMMYPSRIRSTGVSWAYGMGRVGSLVGPSLGGLLLALAFTPHQIFLFAIVPAVLAAAAALGLSFVRTQTDETVAPVEMAPKIVG